MKKVVALIMASVFVFSLAAGCKKSDKKEETKAESKTESKADEPPCHRAGR